MDGLLLVARVVVSLAAVVGLVWFTSRRMGAARAQRTQGEATVRVVDKTALGRHAGIAVLAVGHRRLLVGFGEQQVSLLSELAPVLDETGRGQVPSPRPPGRRARTGATSAQAADATSTARPAQSHTPQPLAPRELPVAGHGSFDPAGADEALDLVEAFRANTAASHPGMSVRRAPDSWPTSSSVVSPSTPAAAPQAHAGSSSAANSPLAGSVLSPQTWRDAVAALQDRTTRR